MRQWTNEIEDWKDRYRSSSFAWLEKSYTWLEKVYRFELGDRFTSTETAHSYIQASSRNVAFHHLAAKSIMKAIIRESWDDVTQCSATSCSAYS